LLWPRKCKTPNIRLLSAREKGNYCTKRGEKQQLDLLANAKRKGWSSPGGGPEEKRKKKRPVRERGGEQGKEKRRRKERNIYIAHG